MLKHRSAKKELLDEDNIPKEDLFQNLKELDTINTLLGGYNITFSAIKKVLQPKTVYSLVDIGCGGGDTLKHIHKWAKQNKQAINLIGIDIKSVCIEYANKNVTNPNTTFICDDYRNVFNHVKQVDIIHACLFCHHLTELELIKLVKFTQKNKSILIVNDLERNVIAYYAIKILTKLFSKSYLVKNDAPLSVARGFKKKEWLDILTKAGAKKYSVTNKWAFRHEVIVYGNQC
ncbi:MAG TPA: methyltransferase domain-containing protein [Bacteroidia bacterium]|nr:methyltransferase domain-containing protein [Bacteroidia bacterium]